MKIWRVIEYTEAFRWYHYATKREAVEMRRQLIAEIAEDWPSATVEIDAVDVKSGKAGIVQAFDDFISLTCQNEF